MTLNIPFFIMKSTLKEPIKEPLNNDNALKDDNTLKDETTFEKYMNLLLKQGSSLFQKEEVKSCLKEQYRTLVKIIFAEVYIYIYMIIIFVFLIFLMLSVILFILVIRVIPFREFIFPRQN